MEYWNGVSKNYLVFSNSLFCQLRHLLGSTYMHLHVVQTLWVFWQGTKFSFAWWLIFHTYCLSFCHKFFHEFSTSNVSKLSLLLLGYRLIGSHSGVKLCRWTKVSKGGSLLIINCTNLPQQNTCTVLILDLRKG